MEPITLQELTGNESGIVVYLGDEKEIIVCNWSNTFEVKPNTLPALSPFGTDLLFLNEADLASAKESVMKYDEVMDILEGGTIIWDINNDLPLKREDYEDDDDYFRVYSVNDGNVLVIAPRCWC